MTIFPATLYILVTEDYGDEYVAKIVCRSQDSVNALFFGLNKVGEGSYFELTDQDFVEYLLLVNSGKLELVDWGEV